MMEPKEITLSIQRLPEAQDLPLPSYATEGAAGFDLYAAIPDSITLLPMERRKIPTGLRMAIPAGYEGQIRARSGLALQKGLGMVNAPGTIDSDYRGEIAVLIINWSDEPQTIRRGERIAQMVIAPVIRAQLQETATLQETVRGSGGFGHTGT
jgi:dUTP pyrophosphatase